MNGLPQPAYVMSEPHLSGYRVIIGYETLTDAQNAQTALCQPQARDEAQPVAWRYRTAPHRQWHLTESATDAGYEQADGSEVERLFTTPPAPEAEKMRVAVEALEPFAAIAGRYRAGGMRADLDARAPSLLDLFNPRDFYRAHKALAALQQEGR